MGWCIRFTQSETGRAEAACGVGRDGVDVGELGAPAVRTRGAADGGLAEGAEGVHRWIMRL